MDCFPATHRKSEENLPLAITTTTSEKTCKIILIIFPQEDQWSWIPKLPTSLIKLGFCFYFWQSSRRRQRPKQAQMWPRWVLFRGWVVPFSLGQASSPMLFWKAGSEAPACMRTCRSRLVWRQRKCELSLPALWVFCSSGADLSAISGCSCSSRDHHLLAFMPFSDSLS